MPKRAIAYQPWLLSRLTDPKVAASYLRSILRDSPELFPKALRKVAEARGIAMSSVAETARVERESIYRMLSETGNPTWASLMGVLSALDVHLTVEDDSHNDSDLKERVSVSMTKKQSSSAQINDD
jgi:probable addiction module antidote protein